jgi:hypothetical protein
LVSLPPEEESMAKCLALIIGVYVKWAAPSGRLDEAVEVCGVLDELADEDRREGGSGERERSLHACYQSPQSAPSLSQRPE